MLKETLKSLRLLFQNLVQCCSVTIILPRQTVYSYQLSFQPGFINETLKLSSKANEKNYFYLHKTTYNATQPLFTSQQGINKKSILPRQCGVDEEALHVVNPTTTTAQLEDLPRLFRVSPPNYLFNRKSIIFFFIVSADSQTIPITTVSSQPKQKHLYLQVTSLS